MIAHLRRRRTRPVLAILLAAAVIAVGLPVSGEGGEVRVLPPAGTAPWRDQALPGVGTPTRYSPTVDEDGAHVASMSRCSASALTLALPDLDLASTPRLRWRWRVDTPLDIPDERVREGDDFAARVYVLFAFDPESATAGEQVLHTFQSLVHGDDVPGTAVVYVWSSGEPEGERWDNPFTASSGMVSLGPAVTGTWRDAVVDVPADYRALFGRPPPPVLGIALMTDSDNSCGRAAARFADFRFLPPAE
jgi:hypothetical protein